eukprot:4606968-Karenia_brevis.AAC.1
MCIRDRRGPVQVASGQVSGVRSAVRSHQAGKSGQADRSSEAVRCGQVRSADWLGQQPGQLTDQARRQL